MSYSPENNERGFTIIELVVGLAIGLILLGVAVKIFLVQQRAYNVQEQLSEMQQNIRSAMDMIVRETKMAGYNPTGASFDGIGDNSSATSIQIKADLTGNGDTADEDEDITYSYDDADLQIERDGAGNPIAENITEFTVLYFNANGDDIGTSTLTAIRQIQVTITGRTDKTDPDLKRVDGVGYRYGTLTTHITPANLDF
ncbi:MAG: PilW family protein [Planctomycetota bacterium]|jgi:type IV pilus assembly protein PilW